MDGAVDGTRGQRRGGREPREGDEDDSEEHHQNPFLPSSSITKSSPSRLQFRKETSRARWVEEMGMGEVIDKKGSMWTTTGVVRDGKLYCHIEEIVFLAERGALVLDDDDGIHFGTKEIYKKIAAGKYGCCWEFFEAYKHLKLLGYIVGRHGIAWTTKQSCHVSSILPGIENSDQSSHGEVEDSIFITDMLKGMHLDERNLAFDVYLPNSKFRKSSPGDPSFILCLLGDKPPTRIEVENLEKVCSSIPLKFCYVDHGRVSFFSFNKVTLPSLP